MVQIWTPEEMIQLEANAIALVVAVVVAWGIFDWVFGRKDEPDNDRADNSDKTR